MVRGQRCLVMTFVGLGALGCSSTVAPPDVSVTEDVQAVGALRVFFGHQSVGDDILQGLLELPAPSLESMRISRGPVVAGTIGHAPIGANGDAARKIDDFAHLVRALEGGVDVALMKLCYADFENDIDIEQLFARYRATVLGLTKEFPNTRFAHVTVPLTTVESGAKAWVKDLLGKPRYGVAENARRERFSQLLRDTYGRDATVFDLAAVETTHIDGKRERTDDGVPVLVRAYTNDGGHLNATGRRVVAAAFVHFLAGLSPSGVAP